MRFALLAIALSVGCGSGGGDTAVDAAVDGPADSAITVSPAMVAHGLIRIGDPVGAEITITNPSPTAAAPLDSIVIAGAGFTMSTTCGASLPPASDCAVTVEITASALTSYAASVIVTSGAVTQTVPLSATGAWQLTIAQEGMGRGTITSAPAGMACHGTCTQLFAGDVELAVEPDAGTRFVSWSTRGCSGLSCAVPASLEPVTVTAWFAPREERSIAITREGSGRITSSPSGLDCGATCSHVFDHGQVTLTATPFVGQRFLGWSELSCGTSSTCVIPAGVDAISITGRFSTGPTSSLDIELLGDADGEVVVYQDVNLVGRCTSSCSIAVPAGTLTIGAATPYNFQSLSATDCVPDGDRCVITPAGSAQVTATFRRDPRDRWTFIGTPGEEFTKGAFDAAGNLVAGSSKRVIKLGPTGALLWERAPTGGEILVAPDGAIYVSDARGTVKLDPVGNELWVRPGGPRALDATGNVLVVDFATGSSRMTLYQPDGTQLWNAPGAGTGIINSGTIYEPYTQTLESEPPDHFHLYLYAHRYSATGAPLADVPLGSGVELWGAFQVAFTGNRIAVLSRDEWDYSMLKLSVRNATTNERTHFVEAWRLWLSGPRIPDGFITGAGDDIVFAHDPDESDVWYFGGHGYQLDHLRADGTTWTLMRFPPLDNERSTDYGSKPRGVAGGPGGDFAMLGYYRPFHLGTPSRPDVGIIQAFGP